MPVVHGFQGLRAITGPAREGVLQFRDQGRFRRVPRCRTRKLFSEAAVQRRLQLFSRRGIPKPLRNGLKLRF